MGSLALNPFVVAPELGFSNSEFIESFRRLPNLYNRVAGMFPERSVTTTTVMIEQSNGSLNIVASRPRNAAADKVTADKRVVRYLGIPHIPIQDVVLPGEIQDVRMFGSQGAQTNAVVLNEKQAKMRMILDQTREFLACGALKGIVLDADGSTLCNLYTEFAIAGPVAVPTVGSHMTLDFVLDNDNTVVMKKVLAVKRHIEMNLRGESMSGIRCLCSSTFYDAFTTHPEVVAAFDRYMALGQNLATDYRKGFTFGGITFEEYNATWTDKDGNARVGITADQGICFPEGTGDTFKTVVAPGNFTDAVNQPGQAYYARMAEINPGMGQGWKLWAESNLLPICKRPEVLVTVTI